MPGGPCRLNLDAIAASLREVRRQFPVLADTLSGHREPLEETALDNLLAGYRLVDRWLAEGSNPFAPGRSRALLELNHLVLCGSSAAVRREFARELQAAEAQFYAPAGWGIEAIIERYRMLDGAASWRRAADLYVQILSAPQLYLEGNHRTGALIASYLLAADGQPPFVLSVANARAYFEPSSLVKGLRKQSWGLRWRRPGLVRRLGALLRDGDTAHLMPRTARANSRPEELLS